MMPTTAEQRHPYKGLPSRAWVRLQLVAAGGTGYDFDMLADTGNPYAVIVSAANLAQLRRRVAPNANTNFGTLTGGWFRVVIPDIGFDRLVIGYGSDAVVAAVQASSPDFAGLVGLPLLRMMEYGGDANAFWVRPGAAASSP